MRTPAEEEEEEVREEEGSEQQEKKEEDCRAPVMMKVMSWSIIFF